ncbi:protease [Amycolatopsis antarctica]|uniref:Protease n=1 Tax=Amycolatopsis antarctica TaxID=1854586 RepID=A0A263CVM4_9PSEU|nr:protease [Amycolatopsis antarctica]
MVAYKSGDAAKVERDAAGTASAATGAATFQRRTATGAAVVDLGTSDAGAVDAALAGFRADPDVAYVEVDQRLTALAAPDDPEYPKQWDFSEAAAGMNVPGAWDAGATGEGAVVAVLDTGYAAHSDVEGNVLPGYDMIADPVTARDNDGRDANAADEGDWAEADGACGPDSKRTNSSWHGTHVAGTVAATANNAVGVAGVAHTAKVQPVRVLGRCGGMTSDIADGIVWASGGEVEGLPVNPTPAKVINLSLGGPGVCGVTTQAAIDGAVARGTSVVVAAGNSDQDTSLFTPANCNNVITVGASNRAGDKAFYSNWGELVDVTAPGGQIREESDTPGTITTPENGILSTVNLGETTPGDEGYKPMMGTSMAAPHVAGLAALMLGKDAELAPAAVEDLLKANARPIPGVCAEGCGAGLADATKTVAAVGATAAP